MNNEMSGRKNQRLYEEELERLRKENSRLKESLRQSQKMEAIGTLAGGIAHDFNNILAPIIGYAEIICSQEKWCDCSKENREYTKNILDAALRAKELISRILIFSRQKEKEKENISISNILNETLELLKASSPATIKIESSIEECGFVLADGVEIQQLFMNLCTNAFHTMKKKGGILSVKFKRLSPDEVQGKQGLGPAEFYQELTVSDTGEGIRKDVVEKIFEPYFTTKKIGTGTGMGLSMVMGIVKSLGGIVEVETEEGKGTLFRVIFPEVKTGRTDVYDKAEKEICDYKNDMGKKILFLDDEVAITNLFKKFLSRKGCEVEAVNCPSKALKLFSDSDFDLIITDMLMPGMTGLEFMKKIRETDKEIPIILCSGFQNEIDSQELKILGVKSVLEKPILIRDLLKSMENIFQKQK